MKKTVLLKSSFAEFLHPLVKISVRTANEDLVEFLGHAFVLYLPKLP